MPTVLLTGASRGIGYELAKIFAKDKYDLVLAARSEKDLLQLAADLKKEYDAHVTIIAKDLSDPNAAQAIHDLLIRQNTQIDVLVNNAGFATYGPFAENNLAREQAMLQVNMTTLVTLTRLLLPQMITRGSGKILNVASTAAFQPGPLMASYYASKAFVLSFSEALAVELHGTGVTVTCLCPGPTKTNFQVEANMLDSKLFDLGIMDARTVAIAGYRGLVSGRTLVIPGLRNRLGAFFMRHLPLSVAAQAVRRLQDRRSL